MALPVNVRDLLEAGKKLTSERESNITMAVVVEADAPEALMDAMQEAFFPRTARAEVRVSIAGPETVVRPDTDVVVVLLGSGGRDAADALTAARSRDIPAIALAIEGYRPVTAATVGQPLDDFFAGPDARALVGDDLSRRIADRLPSKRLALAANFDVMRPAVSGEYVRATAWQNALIGGVTILPGADMPLMTGNQAKMVLQIAAAYGQSLDAERAKELLAVVGSGFAFRAVARQLLDFVPGFGWALKAGVGYTGTIAMGKAAIAYFERGADLGGVVAKLEAGALDVAGKVLPKGERKLRLPRRRAALTAAAPAEAPETPLPPEDAGV